MGARREAEEQDKCHPFVWASLQAWGYSTFMRESTVGDRTQEDRAGERWSSIRCPPEVSDTEALYTVLSSLIHQGAS